MTTKKGDWVRICFNAWAGKRTTLAANLSGMKYRVACVLKDGQVRVHSSGGFPMNLRSWVRVSP